MMTEDLQNWSVLATRAMHDALITINTIDTEDTTEGEMMDELRSRLADLVMQGFLLNVATSRKQLDEKFPFEKLAP